MINNVYGLPEIDFIGGTSEVLNFHVYVNKKSLLPFDVSGCSSSFAIVNYMDKTSEPLISKTMDVIESGGEDSINVLSIKLEPEDTLNLFGKFVYQVTIRDVDGNVEVPQQGIIYIHNNIDKGFLRA